MTKKSAEAAASALSDLADAIGVRFSVLLLILVLLDNASFDQLVNQLLH